MSDSAIARSILTLPHHMTRAGFFIDLVSWSVVILRALMTQKLTG